MSLDEDLARLREAGMRQLADLLEEQPACPQCHGTGWVTIVTPFGDGWSVPCMEGCATTPGSRP